MVCNIGCLAITNTWTHIGTNLHKRNYSVGICNYQPILHRNNNIQMLFLDNNNNSNMIFGNGYMGTNLIESSRLKKKDFCIVKAHELDSNHSFNSDNYIEAKIEHVRHTEKLGHVIYLRLKDNESSILPVYIGDFECAALLKEINKKKTLRPMTHDFMKNCLDILGYKVTKVRITALVANTYHARVHFRRNNESEDEIDVDARPSDALNLAVRFNAPVYVHCEVARTMATGTFAFERESSSNIVQSCREEVLLHKDPTVMLKLQLELAVKEEKYAEAASLRDKIDDMLKKDRALGLIVAIESALDGNRYDEAVQLREKLKHLRLNLSQNAEQGQAQQ